MQSRNSLRSLARPCQRWRPRDPNEKTPRRDCIRPGLRSAEPCAWEERLPLQGSKSQRRVTKRTTMSRTESRGSSSRAMPSQLKWRWSMTTPRTETRSGRAHPPCLCSRCLRQATRPPEVFGTIDRCTRAQGNIVNHSTRIRSANCDKYSDSNGVWIQEATTSTSSEGRSSTSRGTWNGMDHTMKSSSDASSSTLMRPSRNLCSLRRSAAPNPMSSATTMTIQADNLVHIRRALLARAYRCIKIIFSRHQRAKLPRTRWTARQTWRILPTKSTNRDTIAWIQAAKTPEELDQAPDHAEKVQNDKYQRHQTSQSNNLKSYSIKYIKLIGMSTDYYWSLQNQQLLMIPWAIKDSASKHSDHLPTLKWSSECKAETTKDILKWIM